MKKWVVQVSWSRLLITHSGRARSVHDKGRGVDEKNKKKRNRKRRRRELVYIFILISSNFKAFWP